MFIRALLVFLIPLSSLASGASSQCIIEGFTLTLSDFGISDNYMPPNKSVGNHNPALILSLIKEIIIKDQAYSLEGQKFNLIEFENYVGVQANLSSKENKQFKNLKFSFVTGDCNSTSQDITCHSSIESGLAANLKITFNDKLTGTIIAYAKEGKAPLTKHNFSCY